MRRWIWVVLILIVAGISWRVWAMRRPAASEPQPEIARVPVEVTPVATRNLVDLVSAAGTVEPIEEVNVTAKIGGRVAQVYVREGSAVGAGQLLAQLDTGELTAQLVQAEAGLAAARARLSLLQQGARPQERAQIAASVAQATANFETTKANYERMQALFDTGAISKAQLDAAQLQLDIARSQLETARQQQSLVRTGARLEEMEMAQAQVTQAQAAVALMRMQITNGSITSPLSGIVTHRSIDPGEIVTPAVGGFAAPLFTVARMTTVYVTLDVSETDLGKIRPGQPVAISVDAYPDRVFQGVVAEIAQAGDPRTRVFKVKARVENHDAALKPAMFARGAITVGRTEGALVIPRDAVSTDSGNPIVFIVDGGVARARTIRLGGTYGPLIKVLSGLRPGESVVISGQTALTDGTAVTVR